MMDITAIGEVLIDLTQCGVNENGVPVYAANPGGAPANLAVAASRLGAKTAFVGKVGRDAFGALLKKTLADNGVDVRGVSEDPVRPTTLAVVSVDPNGERQFSFYRDLSADVALHSMDIPEELLKETAYLHFGSVSLTDDPSRSALTYAVSRARDLGAMISYDPNYRPSLWKDESVAVVRMLEPLPYVDVLKVSDEEMLLLTGTRRLDDGTERLAKYGIKLVLVTLGAEGAYYRFNGRMGHVPGVPCTVGDTNGAGDTFFGAVLSKLSKRRLETLTIPELEDIIAMANKAASITTSRHGAIPAMPTLDEI